MLLLSVSLTAGCKGFFFTLGLLLLDYQKLNKHNQDCELLRVIMGPSSTSDRNPTVRALLLMNSIAVTKMQLFEYRCDCYNETELLQLKIWVVN